MNEKAYLRGFTKVAMANNVDPKELAKYALSLQKTAEESTPAPAADDGKSFWSGILDKINDFSNSYQNDPKFRATVNILGGAGAGGLAGAGIGHFSGHTGRGALIGALSGGGLGTVASGIQDRDAIWNYLKDGWEKVKGVATEAKDAITGNRSKNQPAKTSEGKSLDPRVKAYIDSLTPQQRILAANLLARLIKSGVPVP